LRGIVLARHEPDFRSTAKGPLSLEDLMAMLGDATAGAERNRQDAIACYLSASEGWSEAVRHLGGAFADETKVKGK
jgi:hypothetical protein